MMILYIPIIDESMLPSAGPEAEELPLRLLYSKMYYTQLYYAKEARDAHRTHERLVTDHVWTEID